MTQEKQAGTMDSLTWKEIEAYLYTIGSLEVPIRMSAIDNFMICPLNYIEGHFSEDNAGEAAHNGTAVGRAIELYHDLGLSSNDQEGITKLFQRLAMEASFGAKAQSPEDRDREPFPLYKESEVKKWFDAYVQDPRNQPDRTSITGQESSVSFSIAPHPLDPIQRDIHFRGSIDQIRINLKTMTASIWDLKSGKHSGIELLGSHFYQQMGYYIGLKETYGPEFEEAGIKVVLGGIIRVRDYYSRGKLKADPQVFYSYNQTQFTDEIISFLFKGLSLRVALVHMGFAGILPQPSHVCNYCPAKGIHNCSKHVIDKYLASI